MNTSDQTRIFESVLSSFQHEALCWHLSNECHNFGIQNRSGYKVFASEPAPAFIGSVISAHVATVKGEIAPGEETVFVPSCRNGFRDRSHWAGIKLPVADTGAELLEKKARRLFNCLQAYSYGRSTLLECCGDGSWQLWTISLGWSSHSTLWKLLPRAADDAAVDLAQCSAFPSPNCGFGLPAPGAWDPASGKLSRIIHADLSTIIRPPNLTCAAASL